MTRIFFTDQRQSGPLSARRWCWLLAFAACTRTPTPTGSSPTHSTLPGLGAGPGAGEAAPAGEGAAADLPASVRMPKTSLREHPAGSAWVFESGQEPRKIAITDAENRGFAVIDLSDSWLPYVFSSKTPLVEDLKPNRYAKRVLALANDKTDGDGDRLPAHAHNYLELYGIPPTLGVVLNEWRNAETDVQACLDAAHYNPEVFRNFRGVLAFEPHRGPKRVVKAKKVHTALLKAIKHAKLAEGDWTAAAEHPKTAAIYKNWRELQDEIDVITQAQIRFGCEGLFPTNKGRGKPIPGVFDSHVHMALASFEKKHNLMGWGHFAPDNLTVLAQSAVESTYARLIRVIRERVIASVGVVEDGSAKAWKPEFRWKDDKGQELALRDVASEVSQSVIEALDLHDPSRARASFERLSKLEQDGFANLLVAAKVPELPAYYGPNMEFEVIIHRGDVWYELPYDEAGQFVDQPRRYFPHITIYTVYGEQKIPLVHWRTTIGSWRSEEHDGREWLVYKNSDVGPRVWRDIVAAPTWIPPEVTPVRTLIKWKTIKRNRMRVVNYDDTGPGYTSAYGLVAAYHVKLTYDENGAIVREWDNQIRTHGSVDYMSILKRFSHGCHRLYNMRAVELFSFILQHRDYIRHGQMPLGYRRELAFEGETFTMALDSRGYRYELVKPIAVNVLEGRIRGKRKQPYEEPIPKPGVDYTDTTGTDASETSTAVDEILPPTIVPEAPGP